MNQFVYLDFDFTDGYRSIATCTFANQGERNIKTCEIMYGPQQGSSCHNTSLSERSYGEPTVTNQVVLQLNLQEGISSYCYILSATNGGKNITMKGSFNLGKLFLFLFY